MFGFELLMAPHAVAHFKLGMQLAGLDLPEKLREKWAYDFGSDERLGVCHEVRLLQKSRQDLSLCGWRAVGFPDLRSSSSIHSTVVVLRTWGRKRGADIVFRNCGLSGNAAFWGPNWNMSSLVRRAMVTFP